MLDQAPAQKPTIRVLIVEDDQLIQRMYATMFGLRKYEVAVASDGLEGLQKAKDFKPTVILLDIMMPQMNGFDTLDKLKADQTTKDIPVIMLSNLADDADIQKALSKGAIKYIIKSEYIPRQVADMVGRSCKIRSPRNSLRRCTTVTVLAMLDR